MIPLNHPAYLSHPLCDITLQVRGLYVLPFPRWLATLEPIGPFCLPYFPTQVQLFILGLISLNDDYRLTVCVNSS